RDSFRPARKEGLGALVQQSSLGRTLEGFLAAQGFTFGIVSLIGGIPTPTIPVFLYEGLCMVLPFAVSLWIGTLYQKNLGGYTGDALGASIEMTELLYLGFFLFFPTNQL
ncbi:MAG: adenosylcobinamide-GDP ribazoletransferase, partial [Treponemataceae bacterium]|nr:adenosylcobinamide-GDP ribazoletransferase [Treponemataceae bacterium]